MRGTRGNQPQKLTFFDAIQVPSAALWTSTRWAGQTGSSPLDVCTRQEQGRAAQSETHWASSVHSASAGSPETPPAGSPKVSRGKGGSIPCLETCATDDRFKDTASSWSYRNVALSERTGKVTLNRETERRCLREAEGEEGEQVRARTSGWAGRAQSPCPWSRQPSHRWHGDQDGAIRCPHCPGDLQCSSLHLRGLCRGSPHAIYLLNPAWVCPAMNE